MNIKQDMDIDKDPFSKRISYENGSLSICYDLEPKLDDMRACLSTMFVNHVCHPCLSTMFVNHVCQPCLSTMFVNLVCQPCFSTMLVNHVCQPCLSIVFVNRVCKPCVNNGQINIFYLLCIIFFWSATLANPPLLYSLSTNWFIFFFEVRLSFKRLLVFIIHFLISLLLS